MGCGVYFWQEAIERELGEFMAQLERRELRSVRPYCSIFLFISGKLRMCCPKKGRQTQIPRTNYLLTKT
jgi:hypothetical protein